MSTGSPGAERASPAEQTNPKEKTYSILRFKVPRQEGPLPASLPPSLRQGWNPGFGSEVLRQG